MKNKPAVAVLVLAGIGIAGYFGWKNKDKIAPAAEAAQNGLSKLIDTVRAWFKERARLRLVSDREAA